ncbi:unnamed protein product [Menidia menidia]|uniref:(Atlantic silverside) hypothetical protein n=1 Tax=Menidia menidia TaxID=238744 RepID=A0A8S4AE84_9TELE|nr:unnamed protein product [Menidia menidia]
MDIVNKENIKVPNSVIVSGITDTEVDENVSDFLNRYGKIMRTFKIDDPQSSYHQNAIVEYESGTSLTALEPLLPYVLESSEKVSYRIRALSSEYVSDVRDRATHRLFCELQEIAKLGGKSFEAVLHEHLSKCSQSVTGGSEIPETKSFTLETQNDLMNPITQMQSQLTRLKPQKVIQPVIPQSDLVTELKAQIAELQSHLAKLKPPNPTKKSAKNDIKKMDNLPGKDNSVETQSVSAPKIVREPETHLDEMNNASDRGQANDLEMTQTDVNETEPMIKDDKGCDLVTEQADKRPSRQRTRPKILTYPKLGNPLVSVVQSLFQSLSEAVTGSIEIPEIRRSRESEEEAERAKKKQREEAKREK